MKKLLLGLMTLVMLSGAAQAEMQWLGLNINPQAGIAGLVGNAGDSGQVTKAGRGDAAKNWTGDPNGFEIELKVVDSAAGAISDDSSVAIYYTHAVNTEDVGSATGFIEIMSITDTSAATGHLFALAGATSGTGGDSVFVRYQVVTAYEPYGTPACTIKADAAVVATSGDAGISPMTFTFEGDEGVDTLFKAWTWVEIKCFDTTLWAEVNVVADPVALVDSVWTPSGYNASDTVAIAGTYGGGATLGRFHIRMFDPGADDDSIISTVYYGALTTVDTTIVTASAQPIPDGIDTNVTLNFEEVDFADANDVFVFHMSDSLHYGKTVKYKLRVGLNVHRKQ